MGREIDWSKREDVLAVLIFSDRPKEEIADLISTELSRLRDHVERQMKMVDETLMAKEKYKEFMHWVITNLLNESQLSVKYNGIQIRFLEKESYDSV